MVEEAEVVIVGGGVIGSSIAYHLAQAGCQDMLLLERNEIGAETTSQAAGFCAVLRTTPLMTRLGIESAAFFRRFEALTGQDPGFRQVGSMKVALTEARRAQLEEQAQMARSVGLKVEFLSPAEAKRIVPILDFRRAKAILFDPDSGYIDPTGVAMGYARGARARGARVLTQTAVLDLLIEDGVIRGVQTTAGTVRARVVVNAAGAWAPLLHRRAGAFLPVHPILHQSLVTDPIPGLPRDMPVVRMPDRSVYLRREVEGLLLGGYEADPTSWDLDKLEGEFRIGQLSPRWEPLLSLCNGVREFLPEVLDLRARVCRGLPTFTPDGQLVLGESGEVRGLYVASGCCARGIGISPNVGQLMAELILEGRSSEYLRPMRADRFREYPQDLSRLRRDCEAAYRNQYSIETGRV